MKPRLTTSIFIQPHASCAIGKSHETVHQQRMRTFDVIFFSLFSETPLKLLCLTITGQRVTSNYYYQTPTQEFGYSTRHYMCVKMIFVYAINSSLLNKGITPSYTGTRLSHCNAVFLWENGKCVCVGVCY